MKLPYGWLPRHWGAKGKKKEIEKAEYELKGKELECRLAEINAQDEHDLEIALLKIDRKYKHISKEEFDYRFAELNYENDEMGKSLARLEVDKKYGKITQSEYEKGIASLHDEPWVGVLGSEYNPGYGTDGFSFELDWNDQFVTMLRSSGYDGASNEQIVEQWFEDKATEEYLGILNEMAEEEQNRSVPATNIHREKTEDGKTKHS